MFSHITVERRRPAAAKSLAPIWLEVREIVVHHALDDIRCRDEHLVLGQRGIASMARKRWYVEESVEQFMGVPEWYTLALPKSKFAGAKLLNQFVVGRAGSVLEVSHTKMEAFEMFVLLVGDGDPQEISRIDDGDANFRGMAGALPAFTIDTDNDRFPIECISRRTYNN